MKDINFFKMKDSLFFKKIKSKSELNKNDDCDGYFIEAPEKECRRIIESLKESGKLVAVLGIDNVFNRRAIETLKVDYLVSPEFGSLPDTLKQRDSGLNHVLAKEAVKRNVKIVIDFSRISKLEEKKKSLTIAKIIQNVKICQKTFCEIKIASFATEEENVVDVNSRIAFGFNLGMSSLQTKNCVEF